VTPCDKKTRVTKFLDVVDLENYRLSLFPDRTESSHYRGFNTYHTAIHHRVMEDTKGLRDVYRNRIHQFPAKTLGGWTGHTGGLGSCWYKSDKPVPNPVRSPILFT
jgi:hypothetical protein